MNSLKTAVLIGNSDGIGLETTRLLLTHGYKIVGLSRSGSPLHEPEYRHIIQDVADDKYRAVLEGVVSSMPVVDLCIYFAGIGGPLNIRDLQQETKVLQVNLMAAAITTEIVVSKMLQQGHGHFIGLSSVMDVVTTALAPSYSASKAGISTYWEGLALSLSDTNIHLSNVRFGFVDTKMAQSAIKPFLLTTQQAADFILSVIAKPRIRATRPRIMGFISWLYSLPVRLKLLVNP